MNIPDPKTDEYKKKRQALLNYMVGKWYVSKLKRKLFPSNNTILRKAQQEKEYDSKAKLRIVNDNWNECKF